MIKVSKTAYQWCLDSNIRILDIKPDEEKDYYTLPVTKEAFMLWLTVKTVKPNTTPRKTDPYLYLEYRMYGIVPYNISPIQAGIQFGHALVEYQQNTRGLGMVENIYNKWATKDKTFIICNGGTTHENPEDKFYGSMQVKRDQLSEAGVLFAEFREPDLNNTLTAVVFLVDERVFNDELYPDYVDIPTKHKSIKVLSNNWHKPKESEIVRWEEENARNRDKWVSRIGGPKNDWLRTFTSKDTLRLANN